MQSVMQSDWQAFLAHNGAEFEDNRLTHFGNPDRELRMALGGNIICDLSHYALLAISGADAADFLQSQFINDIRSLDENTSHLNGYCNPKGRMIAGFRVFKRDDTIYLRLDRALGQAVVRRLHQYKMRSKVEIRDVSGNFVRLGFSGKTAADRLSEILDTPDIAVNGAIKGGRRYGNLTAIRVPGITPSYELYSDEAHIQDIWTRLNVDSAPVGPQPWRLIEVLAGIPHLGTETTEQFVPQMLNYQSIGGLSFEKGCYPGQEIVARMHYLGRLKKRMYLARVKTDAPPRPNQPLYGGKAAASKTGAIVNAERHPDGGYAVLAVIQISDAESAPVHLGDAKGPRLEITALPYPVELEKSD